MCALRHGIRHHPVDTDDREHKRDSGKDGQQHQIQTLRRDGFTPNLVHRANVIDWLIGIDCLYLLAR